MTRKKVPKTLDEIVETLTSYGLRDLTPEGYHELLDRTGEQGKTDSRRIQRTIGPLMKQVLPGRSEHWTETLEGTKIRLALLAENVPLRNEMVLCRKLLGISPNQFKVTNSHPMWQRIKKIVVPGGTRKALERIVVATWLNIHSQAVLGKRVRARYKEILSPEERDSAVRTTKIVGPFSRTLQWLRPPGGDFSRIDPFQWVVERLMQRYRLPVHIKEQFTVFFLTLNATWFRDLTPFSVETARLEHEEPSMTIKPISEYMTKDDWDLIWTNYIRPYQKMTWAKRGMRPQGRRGVDPARLTEALPFYQKMEEKKIGFAEAIRELEEDPGIFLGDTDIEKIRRSVNDLKRLFAPRELKQSPISQRRRG